MNSRVVHTVVVGLLSIQAVLLTYSAKVHSPTWDEVGHLAAGISHWEFGRFELYSVNPPLVRTIAAAPVVLFCNPEMDWSYYRSDPALRSEVYLGRRMIQLNGKDSFHHFFIARLAVIPIALLGGWLCFLWGRDLFGDSAGLIAMTLWTFSPNVLAYGSLITPDLASAVALLGCSYVFWQWMKQPSGAWTAGLATSLALAMLTKSVWLLLPVLFIAIWVVSWWLRPRVSPNSSSPEASSPETSWYRRPYTVQGARLILASLIALVLINGFYGFAGTMRPLNDFDFVSSRFSGVIVASKPEPTSKTDPNCLDCDEAKPVIDNGGNRFASGILGNIGLPLPANYVQGLDVQTRDFERGGYDANWQSYLLGQWKQGGWWYYYLVGLFVKVPLPVWAMLVIGSVATVFRRPAEGDRVSGSWLGIACLVVPAITFFLIVSTSTGLNRYVRYALPVLPVLFIGASQLGRLVDLDSHRKLATVVSTLLCGWLVVESVSNAPHHLSYFNAVAGGPTAGHRFLCDSNVDWGQDLTLLQGWLEEHPEAKDSLHLAYFGAFDPASVGMKYQIPAPCSINTDSLNPAVSGRGPEPGWHVISKNFLVGHSMPIPDGSGSLQFRFFGSGAYTHFSNLEPVDRIGHSMLVYHVKSHPVRPAFQPDTANPVPNTAHHLKDKPSQGVVILDRDHTSLIRTDG